MYAANFSSERANTFPVLEKATEILFHLTKFQPAWQVQVLKSQHSINLFASIDDSTDFGAFLAAHGGYEND